MDPFIDLRKAILNNIPDQAWLKDCNSSYVAVNEAFIAACGLAEADILHKTPHDIWPADWVKKYLRTDREAMRTGKRIRYEETRYTRDGGWRWFDTIKTPIVNAHGAVIGTAGISRDITDRKRSEQALSDINRLYAFRSKVNHAIVRATGRNPLFERVCRIAVESGRFNLAWIGMADASGTLKPITSFSRNAAWQSNASSLSRLFANAHIDTLWGSATRFSIRTCCRQAGEDAAHTGWAISHGFAEYATLPLRQAGKLVGLLLVYARSTGFFSADIVRLLRALSKDLSYALDGFFESERRARAEQELLESRGRLRDLSAFLQSVREEERTRISRELHDELGQSLTALQIGLGVMEHQSPTGTAWLAHVHSLQKIADATVRTVQRIAIELRPPILDELGLVPAIEWLLETMAERSGIAAEFLHPPNVPELNKEVSTALFRIAQESLTNACRHGNARRVAVELRLLGENAIMHITDDGKGMNLAQRTGRRTLGLVGMEERARRLGGTLEIHTSPGAGTRIAVTLPNATRTVQGERHDSCIAGR